MSKLDKNKVVVAMSGGVDSSVAALLLKQQGYEVIGITLKLWDPPHGARYHHTSCCSVEDITDARRVADQIGIPFYVVNSKELFRESVVDHFVDEYLRGRTPNPCALCNDKIKFNYLHERASQLGAYYVATGHYAQRNWNHQKGIWELYQGKDFKKDQSYFLFSLGQKQLEHTLFPVGGLCKEEVRAIAQKYDLKSKAKPESQEICFVPGSHGEFIKTYASGRLPPPGDIVDEAGEIIGHHDGIYHFTVGQRRGTQVSRGQRVYVKSIDVGKNQIVMGGNEALLARTLWAKKVHWVQPEEDGIEVIARIRYRHEGARATLHLQSGGGIRLDFFEPQRAISPGQAVVFYRGPQVLGGGWIERGGQ